MDLTERTLSSETVYQGKIVTLLVDQAEQVLAQAILPPGGALERDKALDAKLPDSQGRGHARLRQ